LVSGLALGGDVVSTERVHLSQRVRIVGEAVS
jgi:hypothetical protein